MRRFGRWGDARPLMSCAAGILLLLTGCAYLGSAGAYDPASARFNLLRTIEPVRQRSENDCGPAVLAIVLRSYGESFTLDDAILACPPDERGVKAGALRDEAVRRGYRAHVIAGTVQDLREQLARGRPVIVGLVKLYIDKFRLHYEVVAGLDEDGRHIVTVDPGHGWMRNSIDGFLSEWEPLRVTLVIAPRKE